MWSKSNKQNKNFEKYDEVKEIEKRGLAVGLKLLRAKVRHLGTEENLQILKSISLLDD